MSMDQTQSKKRIRIFITSAIILLALIAIAMSVYALFNPQGATTTSRSEKAAQVTISERGVGPPTVTIQKGDSITWINQDKLTHALVLTTPDPPQELTGFGSDEAMAQGDSYSFTFDVIGTFTYQDPSNPEKIHGTIIVK